jgi:hypothetical protein
VKREQSLGRLKDAPLPHADLCLSGISHMSLPTTTMGRFLSIVETPADVLKFGSAVTNSFWGRLQPRSSHRRRFSALFVRIWTHLSVGS